MGGEDTHGRGWGVGFDRGKETLGGGAEEKLQLRGEAKAEGWMEGVMKVMKYG